MRTRPTSATACLALLTLLGAAGCGSQGPETETKAAAINGATPPAAAPAQTPAPELNSAQSTPDPLHPVVVIETSLGDIPVVLDRQRAPLTVDNFLSYAGNGHYDETIFHQVYRGYAILGGLLSADMREKPGTRTVHNEARNGLTNRRGTIAMVRQPDLIDSATCQFFINVRDNPKLDYKGWDPDNPNARPEDYGYCVFGQVTPEGMAVVDRIASVPVQDTPEYEALPVEKVVIRSVRMAR